MTGVNGLANQSSLRQRTLTAFVLGPLVMAAVLLLPTEWFALFLAALVLTASWEWADLAGVAGLAGRWLFVVAVAAVLTALWLLPGLRFWLIVAGAVWWVAQSVRLIRLRSIRPCEGFQPWALVAGLLVLSAPWAAMVDLHGRIPDGPLLVLCLMMLIWTADSMAYFVGRRWGHAKLAPQVSPGKTRAGLYGALVGAAAWGLLLALLLRLDPVQTLVAALLCAVTVSVSVVGDLYESLLKRRRGVKDSSHLLPGHGGMLDRVDSLTAAAPVFVLGLGLLGVGP